MLNELWPCFLPGAVAQDPPLVQSVHNSKSATLSLALMTLWLVQSHWTLNFHPAPGSEVSQDTQGKDMDQGVKSLKEQTQRLCELDQLHLAVVGWCQQRMRVSPVRS